jgi:hypothetical protein
MHKKVSS